MNKLILAGLVTATLGSVGVHAHVPHRCQHIDGPIKKQVCIKKWHNYHDVVVRDSYHSHNHHHHRANYHSKVGAKLVVRVPIRF